MVERPQPHLVECPLPPVSRLHLDELTGPFGIWQHATGIIPNQAHGTCTDDVARALLVDLLHRAPLGWPAVRADARRSLDYLRTAFVPSTASFRNFRSKDGTWLEASGSQDSQGRAVLTLGTVIADAPEASLRSDAAALLGQALPGVLRLTALRAIASSLLGCARALDAGESGDVETTFRVLADRLRRPFARAAADAEWPWPEPILTYENALLPRALIVAGDRLSDSNLRATGLAVLDWLIGVQTGPDGSFAPIGSDGWWPRGGTRSRFDQQPIEATATILAAVAASRSTGDERYGRAAEAALGWFLGANPLGLPVAEVRTGGCHDGVSPFRLNANQGAESTLMWQIALEQVRLLRSERASSVLLQLPGRPPKAQTSRVPPPIIRRPAVTRLAAPRPTIARVTA